VRRAKGSGGLLPQAALRWPAVMNISPLRGFFNGELKMENGEWAGVGNLPPVIARRNDEAIQKTYFATLSTGLLRFARNDGGWRKRSYFILPTSYIKKIRTFAKILF
jgi:hypothetical protein